jgi:phosphoribosylformylglycinamidine synthase subunit PurS
LSSYDVRIEVAHRPGILDPQGGVIERALPALGYGNVTSVRVGKSIRLVVDAADEGAARAEVEDYTITVFPGETPVPPSMAPETV